LEKLVGGIATAATFSNTFPTVARLASADLLGSLGIRSSVYAPINYPEGTFSITSHGWQGYPEGLPRPAGPFRLLEGAEYEGARSAANATNNAVRAQFNLSGLDIHEIQPVKFNGSPTDFSNKTLLDSTFHRREVTPWWNNLQQQIERRPSTTTNSLGE
jgi:hypothetical protein